MGNALGWPSAGFYGDQSWRWKHQPRKRTASKPQREEPPLECDFCGELATRFRWSGEKSCDACADERAALAEKE